MLLSFFLVAWAFIGWNRRRIRRQEAKPVIPIAREKMEQGFVPRGAEKWCVEAAISLGCFALGIGELMNPVPPPFSGRWSWLKSWLFESFGQQGIGIFWSLLGLVLVVSAIHSLLNDRQ